MCASLCRSSNRKYFFMVISVSHSTNHQFLWCSKFKLWTFKLNKIVMKCCVVFTEKIINTMSVLLHIALRMCLSKSLKCETKICGSNTAERNKKRKWERERGKELMNVFKLIMMTGTFQFSHIWAILFFLRCCENNHLIDFGWNSKYFNIK